MPRPGRMPGGDAVSDPPLSLPTTYRGTAHVEYRSTDRYGTPRDSREVDLPAQVYLTEPSEFGDVIESNPMHMEVNVGEEATTASATATEGHLYLLSALPTYTPQTGREVLLQYWEYDHDEQSGTLSGDLTNTFASASSAINTFWIQDIGFGVGPTIAFVSAGTTIRGVVTGDVAEFVVEGSAFDLLSQQVPFSVAVRTRRSAETDSIPTHGRSSTPSEGPA